MRHVADQQAAGGRRRPAAVIANTGTLCAEFAGISAAMDLLGGVPRFVSVPVAALGVSLLALRGSFRRVEHVLLALSAVFVAYVLSGFLARPDWGATASGLVVPSIPLDRDAVLVAVATIGTTIAPWGLAVHPVLRGRQAPAPQGPERRARRRDRRRGADGRDRPVHRRRLRRDAACPRGRDRRRGYAARALEPLAGGLASTLFALGFLGAALLAAAIVPLSTAYSVAEAAGARADLNDSFEQARLFYCSYGIVVIVGATFVLIPGVPLIPIRFLTQALNAVLLLVLLRARRVEVLPALAHR